MQDVRTARRILPFLLLPALVLTRPMAAHAQQPITTLFGTGVAAGGGLLPDGAADPHYTLVTSADTAHPGPGAYVVNETGYPIPNQWLADGPNSKWIAPQANQNDQSGQGPGGDPPGAYDYRTTFTLSGLSPASASIAGQWATDDLGTDILINGQSTGITSHGTTPTSSGSAAFTPFTITSGFIPGVNTLDFLVTNASPAGGERFNPTGLRVDLSGQTPVPEASTTISLGLLLALSLGGLVVARKKAHV